MTSLRSSLGRGTPSAGFRGRRPSSTALHITERTFEHHVAHVLDKLGVPSRVQIATWVVGQRRVASRGNE